LQRVADAIIIKHRQGRQRTVSREGQNGGDAACLVISAALAHTENADSVVEGLKLVYEHLKGILRSQGLVEIESTGEKFNPEQHHAITQTSVAGKEDGLIVEELQKGYKLNGRVIRASRVVVNKAPVKAEQPAEEEETKDTQLCRLTNIFAIAETLLRQPEYNC
jgi:hypothetical protein